MNQKVLKATQKTEDGTMIVSFKDKKGKILGEFRFNFLQDIEAIGIGITLRRFQELRDDTKLIAEKLKTVRINSDGTASNRYII